MKKGDAGFTLLEVIVALTILGIAFATLFAGMSGSAQNTRRLEKSQDREILIRNLFAGLNLIQQFRPGDTALGKFADGTRWRLEVTPFVSSAITQPTAGSLVRIEARFEWDGKSGIQKQTIETYRFVRNRAEGARSLSDELHEIGLSN